ncbi:MAG TPA: protein tyrosine phosphatase [Xanthobacteraceae bacterium]|jgi:protein-tyrosine-phosphatase
MPDGHYNILFLSSRNTARSIFAEAVANRLGREHFRGFSAGMKPAQRLDPLVLDVLRVARYPVDELRPKHWEEFAKPDAPPLDFVFTLCDPVAGEPLPHWSGRPITADWRYPDPAGLSGEKWERRKGLARILAGLERQFRAFTQLPFKSLDEISLQARLAELAQQNNREGRARSAEAPSAPPLL